MVCLVDPVVPDRARASESGSLLSPLPSAVRDGVLDNPAWHAMTGPQRHVSEVRGHAARYQSGVSVFHALRDERDERAWADLAALVGPGAELVLTGASPTPPAGWTVLGAVAGVQMVATHLEARPDDEAVRLTEADVPEALDLVARTEPGPFSSRTIELGAYLGIRREGRLVAMAGERMHPPGWTEISAVCTDPAHRGEGLASRLVRAVAHGITARGDRVLLHAAASNSAAIALYERLGFALRRRPEFVALRSPAT